MFQNCVEPIFIALCDPDKNYVTHVSNCIQNYAREMHVLISIQIFTKSSDFLMALGSGCTCIALMVEIDLEKENGFDFAYDIKRKYPTIEIVFITENCNYLLHGYSIPVYRYIIKKNDLEKELHECLTSLINEYFIKNSILNLRLYDVDDFLDLNTVEYVVAAANSTYFFQEGQKNQGIEIRYKLDIVANILEPYDFFRIQKGYMLNARNIVKFSNYKAILKSGIELPVNRKKYRALKIMLENFNKRYAGYPL